MSAVSQPWTVEPFLEWEERQELRWEFGGFHPVAMTGGTFAHDDIGIRVTAALLRHLDATPCRPHGGNLKIEVMGRIRYPDAFVTCRPIARDATVAPEPVVVFEVLSEDTARTDRLGKNREYAATGSIRHDVMPGARPAAGTRFVRGGHDWAGHDWAGHDWAGHDWAGHDWAGHDWAGHLFDGAAVLDMPEIGIALPVAGIYADLDLPDPGQP